MFDVCLFIQLITKQIDDQQHPWLVEILVPLIFDTNALLVLNQFHILFHVHKNNLDYVVPMHHEDISIYTNTLALLSLFRNVSTGSKNQRTPMIPSDLGAKKPILSKI